MQASGASDSPSKGQVSSDFSNVKGRGELEDSFQPSVKVRCICGSSLETESMIQVSVVTQIIYRTFVELAAALGVLWNNKIFETVWT